MSILITGGTGFLGASLCLKFLKEGREVVLYDLLYRIPKFLREYEGSKNLVFVRGDILDVWNLMEAVKKNDVTELIHTAALLDDTASIQRPHQFLKTNILGGINVLEIARIFKLRKLIVISSRAAYGSYAPTEGPLKEEATLRPVAFYGASKAAIDSILPLYRTLYNIDAVSIRTTGIFGPGQGGEGMGYVGITATIYYILSHVLKEKPLSLASGGDHFLEFTYVKDLVRGINLVLDADHVKYPIYNISSGKQHRISEIATMIKGLLPESEINIGPGALEGVELRAALDIRRAQEEFGYEPSPLRESIKDFINYLTS